MQGDPSPVNLMLHVRNFSGAFFGGTDATGRSPADDLSGDGDGSGVRRETSRRGPMARCAPARMLAMGR